MKKIKKEWNSALNGEKEVWRENSSSTGRMLVIFSGPFIVALSLILGAIGFSPE